MADLNFQRPIEFVMSFGGGSGGGSSQDITLLAARVKDLEDRVTRLEQSGTGNAYENEAFPNIHTYDDALDYLLGKSTAPAVTLAFSPSQAADVEVGTSVVSPGFAWTSNKKLASLKLTDHADLSIASTSGNVTIDKTYSKNDGGTQTWTLTGTDAAGQSASASVKITWKHRIFYGGAADGTYNSTFITALSSRLGDVAGTYDVALSTSQNFFIAIPSSKAISKVVIGGFEYSKINVASSVSILNTKGLSVNYDLYKVPTDAKGSLSFVIS